MMPIHIVDWNCVTCFGQGSETLWNGLLANQNAFNPVYRFSTKNYVNTIAGTISNLDSVKHGKRFPALLDLLIEAGFESPEGAVHFTATTKDNIELLEKRIRTEQSSSEENAIHTMIPFLQQRFPAADFGVNINAACASAGMAVICGAECIKNGQTDCAVIWSADLVSEFVFSGFSALKAMSPDTCRPFDKQRNGLILSEAAGYVVLMSQQRVKREKRKSLGRLSGWGVSSDATHITAPDPEGGGLRRAVLQAMDRAGVERDQIKAVSTHGTGTLHNDSMEIAAFCKIFSGLMPRLFSIKGAVGHSMASCGMIELIVSLLALEQQKIPPTTGLQESENELSDWISNQVEKMDSEYALTTNSGFGGINTALLVQKI